MNWKPMTDAPRDGTWILAINNRGNCAVIIWSDTAIDRDRIMPGWIHPYNTGERSSFWNGACGSHAVAWCDLPHGDEVSSIIKQFEASANAAFFDEQNLIRAALNKSAA